MFPNLLRRELLASSAVAILSGCCSAPGDTAGPWPAVAPAPVRPGAWTWFTGEEGAAVEALVDRLIPADALSPSGREAGCAVFIDRQLAGPYGRAERLYMRPPFLPGTPQQGPQSGLTPAAQYRAALAALDSYSRATFGRSVPDLPPGQCDRLLTALENGQARLEEGADGRSFFELLLQNTMEGFFADPIYGGNKDMAGWKMIGFPGTRYDYRDQVTAHDVPYPLPPVGIAGRPEWTTG